MRSHRKPKEIRWDWTPLNPRVKEVALSFMRRLDPELHGDFMRHVESLRREMSEATLLEEMEREWGSEISVEERLLREVIGEVEEEGA